MPQPLKPVNPKAGVWQQEKPQKREAHALQQLESSPHTPQLEKAYMHKWRPSTAKNKK